MDVLSDVLSAVRLTGAVFFDVDASPPWCGVSPGVERIARRVMPDAEHVSLFHAICGCVLGSLGGRFGAASSANAGDVLVVPNGDRTYSACRASCGAPRISSVLSASEPVDCLSTYVQAGWRGTCPLVCGYLGMQRPAVQPLVASLACLDCVRKSAPADGSLDASALPAGRGQKRSARRRETLVKWRAHVRRCGAALYRGLPQMARLVLRAARSLCWSGAPPIYGQTDGAVDRRRLAQKSVFRAPPLPAGSPSLSRIPPMQYLPRWRFNLLRASLNRA